MASNFFGPILVVSNIEDNYGICNEISYGANGYAHSITVFNRTTIPFDVEVRSDTVNSHSIISFNGFNYWHAFIPRLVQVPCADRHDLSYATHPGTGALPRHERVQSSKVRYKKSGYHKWSAAVVNDPLEIALIVK